MWQDSVASCDDIANMTQEELEMGWLASIFWEPEQCRKLGLLGLDQSMFEDPKRFEAGHQIWRSGFKGYEKERVPDSLYEFLSPLGLIPSLFAAVYDEMMFLPNLYAKFALEIEIRSDKRWEAPWTN